MSEHSLAKGQGHVSETSSPLERSILIKQSEHHAGAEVLTGGVLECRAVEQHEQCACFNLIGLRDAAECLGEGGQVARELRADAAVGKEGALLQEFLVHLVGGGSAEACNPEATAVHGNAVAGEVVERVVGTVGEREVFAFVHHLFKVLHGGIDGFLAILQVLLVLRLHVMTEKSFGRSPHYRVGRAILQGYPCAPAARPRGSCNKASLRESCPQGVTIPNANFNSMQKQLHELFKVSTKSLRKKIYAIWIFVNPNRLQNLKISSVNFCQLFVNKIFLQKLTYFIQLSVIFKISFSTT